MVQKVLCILLGILLLPTTVYEITAIEGEIDDCRTTSDVQQAYGRYNSACSHKNDLIVDIIENITQPVYFPYLENITGFGTRVTGSTSCYNTGTYLYNEFQSLGLTVRYQNWTNGGYQDRNIEATLPGVNETSDELYLIFGHFDTVSNCPGADDDASGVATVLTAAYLLSQYSFEHTIRFIAFSGEEQWMLGSHEYVEEAVQNGDNIVAVLNVDMIGYALTPSQASMIKIYDNGNPRWVTNFTVNISQMYYEYIHLTAIPSGFAHSDQTYFWENGFEGIFYHEYKFNDYYHTSQDTIAHMNISYAVNCSRLSIATLATLAGIRGGANTPPETPDKPVGPTEGSTDVEYTFSSQTVDNDSQFIYYRWSWGDEISDWMGPYASGQTVQAVHTWTTKGTYDIRVIAKDMEGALSGWSEPLTIVILGGPAIEIGEITGGFGVHAEIKNSGNADAINVQWTITMQGFVFFGKETTGSFVKIAPGFEPIAATGFIFGIGRVEITVSAVAEGVAPANKIVTAVIVGPFVFRVT